MDAQIKINISANFIGKIWTTAMSLLFVPIYIHFMGIESYGLMGIYASLTAMMGLLDLGLSTTVNRELAKLSGQPGKEQRAQDLFRTLEWIYWAIATLLSLLVVALSSYLAHHWVKSNRLPPDTIRQVILIMGLVIAFNWPVSFYTGGLMGLQRQVLLNWISIAVATLQGVGSVLVLWLISPTVQAFFLWQVAINALQVGSLAYATRRSLPATAVRPRFDVRLLPEIWHFAAGITTMSLLSTVLTQMDKIVLSKLLPLELFGYYSLAWVVANGVTFFVNGIYTAVFPSFTQLVSMDNREGLIKLYHQSAQLLSIILLPCAIVLAMFSSQVLRIWTGKPALAENTHLLISLLVVGNVFNSLMVLPLALQFAHGWTKLSVYKNILAVVLFVPGLALMSMKYGAVGAAVMWIVLNGSYFLFEIPIMHRHILRGEMWRWYAVDVLWPLIGGLSIVILARAFSPADFTRLNGILFLAATSASSLLCAALLAPFTRDILSRNLRSRLGLLPCPTNLA